MHLLNAAKEGNARKVKKLLMAGVPCDWQAPDERTPLIVAARNGHHEVVELLLAKGSCVNQPSVINGKYRPPLLLAVICCHLKVVEMLLAKGADPNQAQEIGASPLWMAAQRGYLEIAQLLVGNGADVNQE